MQSRPYTSKWARQYWARQHALALRQPLIAVAVGYTYVHPCLDTQPGDAQRRALDWRPAKLWAMSLTSNLGPKPAHARTWEQGDQQVKGQVMVPSSALPQQG